MGIMIKPSPPAYLATALHFVMETAAVMYGRFHKVADSLAVSAVLNAMEAASCASAIQGMAESADVSTSEAAATYLKTALRAVWPCLGRTMEHLTAGTSDAFAVMVGGVVSWVETGIEIVTNGVHAMADTILDPNGYRSSSLSRQGSRPTAGVSARARQC